MCFIGYKDNLKVADRDIKCYKCLQSNMKSPCYEFEYEIGKDMKSLFTFEWLDANYKGVLKIEKGLHSYISIETAKRKAKSGLWWYNQVFGCASSSPIVVECIIPKGSQYLTNGIEYVSDHLKTIKVVYNHYTKMSKNMNYQL